MRFHVLGLPHTISTPEYSNCAFTQKVVKLCAMLKMEGHTVFHYGHDKSKVECDENVKITNDADLRKSYPNHKWQKQGFPVFSKSDPIYQKFYRDAPAEIMRRFERGDFLLCAFGDFHKPVADKLPMLTAVESGIGYPNGTFAKFKIYESYAIMHAYQGNVAAISPSNDFWYDAVIPNAFNLDDFDYSAKKANNLLFLGRVISGKGEHIARQIAETTKTKLIIAGPGIGLNSEFVEYVGVVGPKARRKLLAEAKATLCPSTFLEPFCGVQIESMLSGTPVISSDRGAFAEHNIHGTTGYRCKTFEQFDWAARNVGATIKPAACRAQGTRFSLEAIAPMYSEYFQSVNDIRDGKGWYEPRPNRVNLDRTSLQ